MGNYKCRRPGYLSARQLCCVEAVFQGRSDDWICENIFNAKKEDKKAWTAAKDKLRKTKQSPRFEEYYNSMVTEFRVHGYGKAMHRLVDLVDNPNDWVAIQAANSVLNHTEKAVVSEKESQITVKIEGLPEIGVPALDESDAVGNLEGEVAAIEAAQQPVMVEAQVV